MMRDEGLGMAGSGATAKLLPDTQLQRTPRGRALLPIPRPHRLPQPAHRRPQIDTDQTHPPHSGANPIADTLGSAPYLRALEAILGLHQGVARAGEARSDGALVDGLV